MIIRPVKMETSLGGVHRSARAEVEGRSLPAETLWFESQAATIMQRAGASGRMDIVRNLRAALWLSRLRHRLSPLMRLLKSVRRRLSSVDQIRGK